MHASNKIGIKQILTQVGTCHLALQVIQQSVSKCEVLSDSSAEDANTSGERMGSCPLIFGISIIQPSSRYKCPSSGMLEMQKPSSHEYMTNQDKKTRSSVGKAAANVNFDSKQCSLCTAPCANCT